MKIGIKLVFTVALATFASLTQADIPTELTGVRVGSSAMEAKPFLNTQKPTKVVDALAYPITGETLMVAEGTRNVRRVAFLRKDEVRGGWYIAAVRIDYALEDVTRITDIEAKLREQLDEPDSQKLFYVKSGTHRVIFQVTQMPENAPTIFKPIWVHIIITTDDLFEETFIKGVSRFWETKR